MPESSRFGERATPDPRDPGGIEREWRVSVSRVDTRFHVVPTRGLIQTSNWALTTNPRRSTSFWSGLTGRYIRYEYPKTEDQLRRAVALCQEWCDRHNAYEREQQEVLDRVSQLA